MVAVVVMVQEVEVRSGDGEEQKEQEQQGGGTLEQASVQLPGLLLSAVVKSKRSRPEDAAVLVLPSE